MNGMRQIHTDNSGYSLVELIVTILVMSMVTGMVVMLITTSRNTYKIVNTDAQLQGEVQTIKNFISEIAIEASSNGEFSYVTSGGYTNKCIWFIARENEETDVLADSLRQYCYFILYEQKDKVLRYGRILASDPRIVKNDRILNPADFSSTDYEQLMGPVAAGGIGISGDKYGLLANYIEAISCSSTKDSRTARGLITVGLRLEYADQEYVTTLNLEGRNF